jgi:23S rRNA (guanosine2251-2'-O)-methyltransferase
MASVIYGRQAVLEALKAGERIEKIFLLHGAHGSSVENIRALARQHGVPVVVVDKLKMQQLSPQATERGVVALVSEKQFVEISDLLQAARHKGEPPFLLVLDEIEDPHNLGALIRTAECAGMHGVVVPKHHSAPITATVEQASAGATAHIAIAKVTNIAHTLDELKKNGVWIVGTDAGGDRAYYEVDLQGPLALVVGNEGKGIRRLVKEKCDFLVRIPLYGKIASLNVSVAGAIVMFEAARRRNNHSGKT